LGTVTQICTTRTWTLEEAKEMIPLVSRLFDTHEQVIKQALEQQRFFMKTGAPKQAISECDDIVNKELVKLGSKLVRLGIRVLGDYFVGFDSGQFLWSYMYKEQSMSHWHGYYENPRFSRHKISFLEVVNGKA